MIAPRPCLLALLGFAAAAGPAAAFDCARAKAPVEKAICSDPAAKASDAAMEAAFEAVRSDLSVEERGAILDDQRAWLKERNDGCASEAAAAACLTRSNEKRTAVLTARPESGPGFERRPRPLFIQQAGSRTKIAVALRLYRFGDPQGPGERTLNAEADRTVSGIQRIKDEPDDRDWSREESWTIAYASPAFLSIVRETWEYSGGAHGLGGTSGLNIDMKAGRVLTASDLFDDGGKTRLSKLCTAQIREEKKQRGADANDVGDLAENVAEGVGDLANWSFTAREASVHFGPYALGSYAEGAYTCTLPIEAVNRVAERAMPLR